MIPPRAAPAARVKPGLGDPPGVGLRRRSWDHDADGPAPIPVRNPDSKTDMAPSDTSETTPAPNPVRDRAAADAQQDRAESGPVQDRLEADAVRDGPTANRLDSPAPVPGSPDVGRERDNGTVGLARIAWLVTVLACVVTIVILMVEGYYGYALVTLAVAVSAGINLT
jgi:hypothetical protein